MKHPPEPLTNWELDDEEVHPNGFTRFCEFVLYGVIVVGIVLAGAACWVAWQVFA